MEIRQHHANHLDRKGPIPVTTAPARLYGPNGQPVNGHTVDTPKRAEAPTIRFAPFPITLPRPAEHAHPEDAQPAPDPIAEAEAEAIRARAAAEAEERRIKAEAEADAIRTRADAEAEKQRLANERAAQKLERESEEHAARLAETRKRREATEREAAAARAQAEAAEKTEAAAAEKVEASAKSWRTAALTFAIVCAVVALPVQMSAFWSPKAPWLLAAPLVLEGGAWVVLRGAAAAVDEHRPHWHYRLIAWSLAFLAAGINLAHGLPHFGIATAAGTAFASLAGPGIWDLHEHGRIRLRDGKPTRRERSAAKKAAKQIAKEEAAAAKLAAEERQAAEAAAKEAATKLAAEREDLYPEVWKHAVKLAAALGEATVTEAVWQRAHKDIRGAEPGEDAETIRARNAAAKRVEAARTDSSVATLSKAMNAQRANQMPRAQRGPARKPPVRRAGDTPRYVNAARKAAADTARRAARNDGGET